MQFINITEVNIKLNSNSWKLFNVTTIVILCLAISIYLLKDLSTQHLLLAQGTKMSEVKISVCVDDAHLSQIEKISQQLKSSGMNIEQTLPNIGILSGSIQADRLNSLYQIEGVQNVEPQESYQLAPPSSEIQ